ncbi:MAG: hypothetical protein E7650_03245 [Ruminococcaceae bacterium]|nr:hypothetical protein [Oscillospiraceae bacterium]
MKKFFTLLCLLLSLLCLFSCTAVAANEPLNDDGDPTEFVLSDDERILTYGDITYKLFRGYPPLMIMPKEMYVYSQRIHIEALGYRDALIMRNLYDRNIIIFEGDDGTRLYVTPTGEAIMNRYLSLDFPVFTTYEYPRRANVPGDLVLFLDGNQADQQLQRVEVSTLQDAEKHIIYGMDETGTFGHEHGAVYVINDEYWYINYDALDNTYFDSYGYFSYRSGKVTMKKVDKTAFDAVLDAREEFHIQYTYQSDNTEEMNADGARIIFALLTMLFLMLPVAALSLALVLYLREPRPRRRRYLISMLLASVWLLLLLVMLIIIISS